MFFNIPLCYNRVLMGSTLNIPSSWEKLELEKLTGTIMIVGGTDTGKSTFSSYLYQRLQSMGFRVGFLDGDPGQSALGPPTTMSLIFNENPEAVDSYTNTYKRCFVGSTTPQGHMLHTLIGASKLVRAAIEMGAEVVIYDTSGLISVQQGGVALKSAKIELFRPTTLFAIQYENELEPLLTPLRRSCRTQLIELYPSEGILPRDPVIRREYRASQFARYFGNSRSLVIDWTEIAIFPSPLFRINRLVALEDFNGFTLGLGIVIQINRNSQQVVLHSPLSSLGHVNVVRLGDILLDPITFRDERIV